MVPVQFITHQTDSVSYKESALLALEGGCTWIQLRMKGATDDEAESVALELLDECRKRGATFILDDRVQLCKKIGADGVHLGKNDMPVNEARELLGHEFIIGGTANTFDDIKRLRAQSADYIGCGPFRFTRTKDNLAPILGLDGYRRIVEQMQKELVRIPVCAIGGIELADVPALLDAGVQGVAVSGAILRADNPQEMMRRFLNADI